MAVRKMRSPMHGRSTNCSARKTARSKLIGLDLLIRLGCGCLLTAGQAFAEPLASPSFGGPLKPNPNPIRFDAGPLGDLYITGQLTGIGIAQSNAIPFSGSTNTDPLLDLSNAQIEIQTIGKPLQFYVQSGVYALPSLGTAYVRAKDATDQLYGLVPVYYGKLAVTPNLSVQAGSLPTLIGEEFELYVPEHDHHRRAVVEPAARDQPRRAGQIQRRSVRCDTVAQRRVLFEHVQLGIGPDYLCHLPDQHHCLCRRRQSVGHGKIIFRHAAGAEQ